MVTATVARHLRPINKWSTIKQTLKLLACAVLDYEVYILREDGKGRLYVKEWKHSVVGLKLTVPRWRPNPGPIKSTSLPTYLPGYVGT